jgi:hypothetical protein
MSDAESGTTWAFHEPSSLTVDGQGDGKLVSHLVVVNGKTCLLVDCPGRRTGRDDVDEDLAIGHVVVLLERAIVDGEGKLGVLISSGDLDVRHGS